MKNGYLGRHWRRILPVLAALSAAVVLGGAWTHGDGGAERLIRDELMHRLPYPPVQLSEDLSIERVVAVRDDRIRVTLSNGHTYTVTVALRSY